MEPHRSIQDIIPPARSRPIRSPMPVTSEPPPREPPQPPAKRPPANTPRRPSGFFGFAVVLAGIIILIGVVIALISTVFYRAYVTVTPYTYAATVQDSFETSPSSTVLPYQKVIATDTATKSVPATGTQHVENHSSGTITIYNSYTTTSQRLITNTRFSTKDGLIFRVHAPIVIPGYTMKAGVKVPGTVDAVVYADEAGDKYNVSAGDFTVPGLKGSKQYELIYAKSKGTMAGGFVGQQAVVDPSVRTQTVEGLKADLDRTLRAKILESAPVDSIVFNDTVLIQYSEGPDTVDGDNAVISVSGSAMAPAVNGPALARAIGDLSQMPYDGPLTIDNPNNLNVQVDAPDALGTETPIHLAISGTANLLGVFDQAQLVKDLAGKDKKDIQTVLPNYPAISNIDIKIYPFWRGGIPADLKKVEVKEAKTEAPVDGTR